MEILEKVMMNWVCSYITMSCTLMLLRSLALPFTVLEWTLPTIPSIAQKSLSKQLSMSSNQEVNVTPSDIETPNASDSSKRLSITI